MSDALTRSEAVECIEAGIHPHVDNMEYYYDDEDELQVRYFFDDGGNDLTSEDKD